MADQYSVRLDIQYETIKGLKTALAEANKELENAKINTVEWTNAFKKVGELKGQMIGVTNAMRQTVVATQQTSQASANAGMALLNLNYVIRDSPYFFQNFALGVLAVGNNLNPLIDSFARLRQEAGAKSLTTFALLRQALVGGAGLSIAFSVVVTAIQAFVFWQAKAGKESGETAKEVDLLTEALERFVKVDMPSGKTMFSINPEDLKKVIGETQKQLDDVKASLDAIAMKKSYGSDTWNDNTEKATKEATKSKEELEKIKKILEEDLKIYNQELRAREILGNLGIEEVERHKEKTKQLKAQKEFIAGQRPLLMELVELMREYNALDAVREMGGGRPGTSGGGLRPGGLRQMPVNPMDKMLEDLNKGMKEFHIDLEMAKVGAQELGKFLSDAFMKGKFALDEFIKSLTAAVIQMLTIQAIMSFLNPVGTIAGAGVTPTIPKRSMNAGSMGKSAIRVIGKITADKNNFIANIRNADNYYSRNEEFVLIGR